MKHQSAPIIILNPALTIQTVIAPHFVMAHQHAIACQFVIVSRSVSASTAKQYPLPRTIAKNKTTNPPSSPINPNPTLPNIPLSSPQGAHQ